MSTDPIEDLRDLSGDPFAGWRDAAALLPAALEELSRTADDLADFLADVRALGVSRVESLALSIGHVLHATRVLAANSPRPANATTPTAVPAQPWEWRWPSELTIGAKVRFADGNGFTPFLQIRNIGRQITPGPDVYVLALEGDATRIVGHDEVLQVLLVDEDARVEWFEARRQQTLALAPEHVG